MMRPDTIRRATQEFNEHGFKGFTKGSFITVETLLRHHLVERYVHERVTELSMEKAAKLLTEAQSWGYVESDPLYESTYEVRNGHIAHVERFTRYRFIQSALEEAGIL